MDHPAPAFECIDRGGEATLVITGDVDLGCADELRAHLQTITASAATGTASTGVVDLAGVTFLDSSGLGILIAAKKRAAATGADLTLATPSAACRTVLDISGAAQFFEIRD